MEKNQDDLQKAILLLSPPFVNNFYFSSQNKSREDIQFIELHEAYEKYFSEKKTTDEEPMMSKEKMIELIEKVDYSEEVKTKIQEEKSLKTKILIVNYPYNEEQLIKLNSELKKINIKITKIILVSIDSYELIEQMKSEFLICPFCKKSYNKEVVLTKDNDFLCPQDSKFKFPLEKIIEFNEDFIKYYFKNTPSLIEKLLHVNNNFSKSDIIKLLINKKEDATSEKIQEEIFKLTKNI